MNETASFNHKEKNSNGQCGCDEIHAPFSNQDTITYSLAEVAEKLNISQKSVRKLIASGSIKSEKIGGSYRVSAGDLNDFATESVSYSPDVEYDLWGNVIESPKRKSQKALSTNHRTPIFWADISQYWNKSKKSEMTFVDLFCGCGGLSKGLELAGLEGICGLDWFTEACMTYNRNFSHPFINGDITLAETKNRFYETVKKQLNGRRLNVVAGGFPCQGFSMAGHRIVNDPRNSLYLEMLEIVKNLQPDFVICENVKGLRSMLNGNVERKIVEDYRSIGYEMNVATLCAADYYTPQKRERVIFIGNRIGRKNYHPLPILQPMDYVTTGQAISDLMEHPADEEFNHLPTRHRPDMAERMLALREGESLYKGYSDAWKKCPWDEPSCTIKENHGGVNIHPKLPRVLTAREMARLQSFPDDFIFMGPKNKQLVQIGNAVPPFLGKAIGLSVRYSNDDL